MKGLTESLWPVRYKPYPDELLTSWLVRLAWGHGLKVQTFCNLVFGGQHQVWNRDVDRTAPDWLVNELARKTGTPAQLSFGTTLRGFEGVLYSTFRMSGTLPWIQTLMVYHRKRTGYGIQFCPACLAEDEKPYFRRAWRVSFYTMCAHHNVMMHDCCPKCSAPVIFHRMEMGRGSVFEAGSMGDCHACGMPLAQAPRVEVHGYDDEALCFHMELCQALVKPGYESLDLDVLRVLHQLARLSISKYKGVTLRPYLCDRLGVTDRVDGRGQRYVETLPLVERHHLVQLAAWLFVDLGGRLEGAWKARALRYNHMLKDFDDVPRWYLKAVRRFSNWRYIGRGG